MQIKRSSRHILGIILVLVLALFVVFLPINQVKADSTYTIVTVAMTQ